MKALEEKRLGVGASPGEDGTMVQRAGSGGSGVGGRDYKLEKLTHFP